MHRTQENNSINVDDYRKYLSEINVQHLKFPLSFRELKKLEILNTHLELSLSVYDFDEKQNKFGSIYNTNAIKRNHVELLLIYNKLGRAHFTLILNLVPLVRKFITKNLSSAFFLCRRCLTHFTSFREFNFHLYIKCSGQTFYVVPEIDFNRYNAKQSVPFFAVFDIETYMKKYNDNDDTESESESEHNVPLNQNKSYTKKLNQHIPVSTCYKIYTFCDDKKLKALRLFRSENCIKLLMDNLISDIEYFYLKYQMIKAPITPLTDEILRELNKAEICFVCNKKLLADDELSASLALDHIHLNHSRIWETDVHPKPIKFSNNRFYIHTNCNLLYNDPLTYPVLCHNASYDLKFVLSYLLREDKFKNNLDVICRSQTQIIAVVLKIKVEKKTLKILLLDSYQHLHSSLNDIALQCDDLHETKSYFEQQHIQFDRNNLCKLPFFYERVNSPEFLDEINSYPSIDFFYSSLTQTTITQELYEFGRYFWQQTKCRTYGDLLDHYIAIDTLLLYDIMLVYKRTILKLFDLEPLLFFSSAALSYNIFLSKLPAPLKIPTDITMINILLSNIKAGLTFGTCKEIVSNCDDTNEGYKPEKGDYKYVLGMDIIGLYSNCMREFRMPVDNYEWIREEKTLENILNNIQDLTRDSEIGFYFFCKIKYPKEIHDKTNNYPILCENAHFIESKTNKLISTLLDKDFYCGHYLLIQNAIQHGLIVEKIYYAIKFRQEKIFSSYISQLIEIRRNEGTPQFLQNITKIHMNSLYGKCIGEYCAIINYLID